MIQKYPADRSKKPACMIIRLQNTQKREELKPIKSHFCDIMVSLKE